MNFVKIGNRLLNLNRVDWVDLGNHAGDPVTVYLSTTYEQEKSSLLAQAWVKFGAGKDADEARRVFIGLTKKELAIAGG